MSVRALAAVLAEENPNLRGTSYSGVRSYAEGRVANPRIELLRAIADVLGVRSDWLAFGFGAMTRKEEHGRTWISSTAMNALFLDPNDVYTPVRLDRGLQIRNRVLRALGLPEPPGLNLPAWVPAIADVEARLEATNDRFRDRAPPDLTLLEDHVDLTAALSGAVKAFGLDAREIPDIDMYVMSMVPLLLMLAQERGRQLEDRPQEFEEDQDE